MTSAPSPREKNASAQGMVEFALALPLLLVLILGLIESGRLLFIYSATQTASREGARYGSAAGDLNVFTTRYQDCAGIRSAARRVGSLAGILDGNITITYDRGPGTNSIAHCNSTFTITDAGTTQINLGDRVNVQVVTTYRPLIPLSILPSFPITAISRRTIIKNVEIEGTPPAPTPPNVYFAQASQDFPEDGGTLLVRVQLSAATSNSVSVPLIISGTATGGGVDYTLGVDSVVIPPGEVGVDLQIPVIDDVMDEDDETIVLVMGPPSNATRDAPDRHTATILDNDLPPRAYFSTSSQAQSEELDMMVTVELSAPSSRVITVNYSLSGSAAQGEGEGFDYNTATSPLVIPAGSTSVAIALVVEDDLMDEDDETVVVTMGEVINATKDSPDEHTATILDNDLPPEVAFTWDSQSADESVGSLVVEFILSAVSSKEITVPYSIGGTATRGVDYSVSSGPIVIPAGETSFDLDVTLMDEGNPEEIDETIVFSIETPINATLGTPSVHTATITATPVIPNVRFTTSSQNITEDGRQVYFVARLSSATNLDVSVPFALAGSATQGVDYDISTSPVIISAGHASARIYITPVDDVLDEDDETVVVVMGPPVNATKGVPDAHTATIIDQDDQPSVYFSTAAQSGTESVGTLTITLNLSTVSGREITVPYTLSGTATLDSDYTFPASPAIIPAGSISVGLSLGVIDDTLKEPDEQVIVTLGTPINALLGTPGTHTATIIDNEPICPSPDSLPFFGTGADVNKLAWTLQSPDPAVVVNLLAVTIRWPAGSEANVTAITFGSTLFTGNALPPYLSVNTPVPLWSGAFSTQQMIFKFSRNPKKITGDFYQLTATFQGCPPISGIIPSD